MENLMVSVFVLTYNQEAFIGKTLSSILEQKTSFQYNIIIGDDASTDGTSKICDEFKECYPDKIILVKNPTNLGLIKNFVQTAKFLKGRYIAICDGDDYWIDNRKLQKQVNFLEKNPQFSIVGSQVKKMDTLGKVFSPDIADYKEYTVEDMINDNRVIAPTAVFRNFPRLQNLPQWFEEIPYGDWPVYLLLLAEKPGFTAVLPDITAVYRSQIGASAKIRENLSFLFSVKSKILSCLLDEPAMRNYCIALKKSLIRTQMNQISALNRRKLYFKGFGAFGKVFFKNPSAVLFRLYAYSIYKSLRG